MSAMWWGLIIGGVMGVFGGVPGILVFGFLGWLTGVIVDSYRKKPAPPKPGAAPKPTSPPVDRLSALERRVAELEAKVARYESGSAVVLEGSSPLPLVEGLEGSSPSPLGEGRGEGPVEVAVIEPTVEPEPKVETPPPIPQPPEERKPNPLIAWITGGNAIARVGIIVLFIGVAFLLRYAVDESLVPPGVRVLGVGAFALALLALGWKLRVSKPGYGLSLQGAGVGLLYLTIYGAFRLHNLLPETAAFVLLAAVAVFATWLAIRQDAEPLAGFGAAGGFLAPVLASSGQGDVAMLFGYYAVLDLAIFATAWFRSWRSLNAVGFIFTFAMGLIWGMDYYQPEHFWVAEPFLVFFFLLYVAVAILFARFETTAGKWVDGALVFGTPLGAIALQSGVMKDSEYGMAWSSVALAVFYLALGLYLHSRPREGWKALARAFFALAIVFATFAIPLAFEPRWTATAWALEGAAVVWYGVNQNRKIAIGFGLLLQILAGFAHIGSGDRTADAVALANGPFLGAVLVAIAGLASHLALRRTGTMLSTLAFIWSIAWWIGATFTEAEHFLPKVSEIPAQLAITAATALVFAAFHARMAWREAAWPSELMVPAMLLFLLALGIRDTQHPFIGGGWAAWAFVAVAHLVARRWVEAPHGLVTDAKAWLHHAGFVVVAIFVLSWEANWQVIDAGLRRSGWASPLLVVVPVLAMLVVSMAPLQRLWPIAAHPRAYLRTAMFPVLVALFIWDLAINLLHNGRSSPLPYIPLINSVDLAHVLALGGLVAWWRSLERAGIERPAMLQGQGLAIVSGAAAFAWANGILLRSLHHWADVPYRPDAWMTSFVTQAALSIFWSVLALTLMVWATRRISRGLWMVGAMLMAIVVAKLFFVDFQHLAGIERIASFIGVGVLMLVIGYLAPVPPKGDRGQTPI